MSRAAELRLDIRQHRLGNGLRVVLSPDPSIPLVAVNVCYHAGSREDGPGRSGTAHMLEHLFFQGSRNVGPREHFRRVQQVGGSTNGATLYNRTYYFETLPSEYLELALWLESDRMGFFLPTLDSARVEAQRRVILNERRQRIENRPYGRAFERVLELLYSERHPYGRPVIGSSEDIARTSREDLEEFFSRYYSPGNAVITVAGDVTADDALRGLEDYFGAIPAAAEPSLGSASLSPPAVERAAELEDRVALPRLYLAYQMPGCGEPMWYAGDLLARVLGEGRSGLLHDELVDRHRLAHDVRAQVFLTEQVATLVVTLTASSREALPDLRRRIDELLERLAAEGVPGAKLDRARRHRLLNYYRAVQGLTRRAALLSMHATYFGDARRLHSEADCYRDVGEREVRDFLGRYCARDHRAALTVLPAGDGG